MIDDFQVICIMCNGSGQNYNCTSLEDESEWTLSVCQHCQGTGRFSRIIAARTLVSRASNDLEKAINILKEAMNGRANQA